METEVVGVLTLVDVEVDLLVLTDVDALVEVDFDTLVLTDVETLVDLLELNEVDVDVLVLALE